jgi:glucan biosynthesis protein C
MKSYPLKKRERLLIMKNIAQNIQKPGRIYFFDWLRLIALALVVLIHSLHMFGDLYKTQGSVDVRDTSAATAYAISFLTYWCMALFFLLAGASTWFALRRRTSRQFIQERFKRLLVPFGLGFILLVPLQGYFDMVSNGLYNGTLLAFYPFFFKSMLFDGHQSWAVSNLHHLWFLLYLFAFSLITLPLCQFLRSERGQIWIERLACICEKPGGMLIFVLPPALVLVALRALFPVYCSVADILCWTLFYLYGYIIFSHPRLQQALQHQARLALGMACGGLLAILFIWRMGVLHHWLSTPDYSAGCLLFQVLTCLILWAALMVILAAAYKYLNRSTPILAYSSTASFSLYLVHFPVVVIVAFYILPLHFQSLTAFLLISAGTSLITVILSDLFLMRTSGTRSMLALLKKNFMPEFQARQTAFTPGWEHLERTVTGTLEG